MNYRHTSSINKMYVLQITDYYSRTMAPQADLHSRYKYLYIH